ncbi:serine/threonine-protein kinase [Simiduia agarivorans]|uniref:Serine/threonine protein kinase n=1 Tax=Simiduia agarivorans (strain DSM 21679 / JCM 13881 / BCRC 17597 / SA1) TaxID=1117647 RepID=K4KS54_SIMAS|nr:serine/threonine-protein kinase [Simiduia agarivorans]AFV00999.1 serine/threonine protein kinase [Simiduia agarivorans SA1 = DSM 21679]
MSWSRALGRFLLSSHVVYLLLACAFVVSAHWPVVARGWIDWLDNRTLSLGYSLQAQPQAALSIAVAEVPSATFQAFTREPLQSPLLEGLENLRALHKPFHVFLSAPVWTDQLAGLGNAQALADALATHQAVDADAQAMLGLLEQLARWHRFRTDGSSLWFLPAGLLPEASGEPLDYTPGPLSQPGPLNWLLAVNRLPESALSLGWQMRGYQFVGDGASQPLWWQTHTFQRIQGAPLLLAAQARSLTGLNWQAGTLSASPDWRRPVGASGLIPVDWRLAPTAVDMMAIGRHLDGVDLVLVAEEGDPLPLQVAATANTLLTGHYPIQHRWAWASQPFWPLLLCLLTLPLWRSALLWPALVGSLLLTGLLVASQLFAHVGYGVWLPTGALVLWLWSALGWRLWCAWRGRSEARLERSWTQAWQRLVRENINSGKLAEAEAQLLEATQTRESHWQLPVCMELAQAFEKQRRYDQAEKLYESIVARAGNFQGVTERLQRLKTLSGGGSLESTLIIDEQIINKPVLGRYEIQRELGRGAMGIVYLGRDPKIARMVAIKTLQYKQFDASQLPELKARFFREAEAAGRLSHPNIVSVFDVGEESDLAYIAMDYVPGRALSFYTAPNRLLPVPIVYGLMAKAADALHYAHKHKIVHRDVKPGNLLYDPESGRLKVSDFGIARLVDNSKTRTGDVMGSPLYMSPEQLKGDKVSEAADIYSLGVTMYQLLTGKLPYDGDTLANLTYQILNAKHASVRSHREELPPSATRITNKALQKSPADRFSSAKEMADTLRKSLARDFD